MGMFGKLFDPAGESGSEETGKGERYDPNAGRAEVDLDAGVLILPDYGDDASGNADADAAHEPDEG
ncbi:hypothetical protein [Ornithinicoccus hortensis]|uniref:Uncharacterized protein n=1 Tax=Ornithinicoccus hortensis TaxID=82346 RepID=A0A542YP68_9MICO|nr:hypothetical protein [Ornithinicoccus hortensis]TQL49898.1 hypothetical protein FB467_0995 [Ornithinicoccus hortensis]